MSRSFTDRHARWVRYAHGVLAASVLTLMVSGALILMVHPRLYWGEIGNDLTPALLELPISRNFQHGGWTSPEPFSAAQDGPVSASRTYDIFNQNGWARSLHFLAAWFLIVPGACYLWMSVRSGHLRSHLWPAPGERTARAVWRDVVVHLRLQFPHATGGPQYGLLQKLAYLCVATIAAPLLVVTGMTMSPAVTASMPWLLSAFGGYQSARTVHFATFVVLALFVVAHLVMVVRSGFVRQVRAITVGD